MMEPKWLRLSVLCLLLEICAWCSTDACLEYERIALLQLKPFFNLHNDLSSWVENDKGLDCCEWEGVECNTSPSSSRRLIGLSLNYTRWFEDQMWYLNSSLFLPFKELKRLDLSGNNIAGCVENEDFAKLSLALDNLEILDLSGNYLNDTILLSLSQLSSLKHLYLSENSFTGSNYAKGFQLLSRLSNLETLDFTGNFLKNGMLIYMGNLSSLKTLNLGSNSLKGTIYIHELNTLSNLKNLDLSNNRIENLRPSNQGKETQLRLTNLGVLDLSNNLLKNNTFSFLRGLSSLKYLYMGMNRLQGSIYIKDLGDFTHLEELDLSLNPLNEFVAHKEFKSLRKLRILYLDDVFTNGSIPLLLKLVAAFPSVKTFLLGGSYLNNTMATQELHLRNNVEEIFLDYSYLNNNILQSIGVLASLKTLSLFGCGLTGTLPSQGWCDLRNLEELDISWNALEGILPYCLGNLTSLRVLDISYNQFTGNLTHLANLTSLRFISLSRNHFQISMSFTPLTNLPNLKVLLSDKNKVVESNSFHTLVPKFQLNFISLSKCTIDQELNQKTPKFLFYQYNLRYVDLSYSNLSRTVPFWLLENNTKLENLFLMGNSLTGPLLLAHLLNPKASSIDISNNRLQGQIPTNICSTFPNLRRLFLSNNDFEGNIPSCLSGMRSLSILDLSNNHLSGRVPEELFVRSSLKTLRLSNNNLSGKIVHMIFNSRMLSELYLDGNNFVGEIPDIAISSANFSYQLEDIDLSNNNLRGKIPRWMGNVLSLVRLVLSNNQFEGSVPKEFCNLYKLEFLELSQNNLSGSIPSCFNQTYLTHVHLNGNRLSGQWTHAFYNSSSLVTLDLRGNNLIGNIPEWIDTLSTLSVLLLKANHLDGGIPIQLCKLNSLSILDLSENMFSGLIPSCLGNLTLATKAKSRISYASYGVGTTEVASTYAGMIISKDVYRSYPSSYMEEWIEFTTKSASYSYSGDILDIMSGIDLSCNKLTGQIPDELGQLSGIHSLNLSHNHLIGVIPSSFSQLKLIESLDLSYNNLSGRIPTQLVELNSLEVFSVAYNNLSGSIPEPKAQFGTFDESSYKGNPFLCGPPLHKNCSKTRSPSIVPTKSHGEGEGSFIDTNVFCVSFLVSYVAMLSGIFVILYIHPTWQQEWFSFIEGCITTYHYSIVGNFLELFFFKRCA